MEYDEPGRVACRREKYGTWPPISLVGRGIGGGCLMGPTPRAPAGPMSHSLSGTSPSEERAWGSEREREPGLVNASQDEGSLANDCQIATSILKSTEPLEVVCEGAHMLLHLQLDRCRCLESNDVPPSVRKVTDMAHRRCEEGTFTYDSERSGPMLHRTKSRNWEGH